MKLGRRRGLWLLVVIVSALGLSIWLWPRPKYNLLLITLDTTRADRLGCYGHSIARTPHIDSLASAGVLFTNAYTVAPYTLPAHTSLLAGLYPAESGVVTNGQAGLNKGIPTLADVLRRNGYETAAYVAAFVLNARYGLDQGFDVYDDELEDSPLFKAAVPQRMGTSVVSAALEWLARERARPFFCWVHLYDAHTPYVPHGELFGEEFSQRPYDGEIAYLDHQVGRLLALLREQKLDSRTLVVIVGDHGESLGEHGDPSHGLTLYNATMRVPLIFRHPDGSPAEKQVHTRTSIVDVSPTILELLGLPDPREISGKSFASSLRGGQAASSPCYGATDEPYLMNSWSPLRCLTDGDWKYIRTTRPELYNLSDDPAELHNLAADEPDKVRTMELRMSELEGRMVARKAAKVQLSSAEIAKLQGLGYVGGAPSPRDEPIPRGLPDIKDMLRFQMALWNTSVLANAGAVDAQIGNLQLLIREAPTLRMAYFTLFQCLIQKSEFGEAAEVLLSLLDADPKCSAAHFQLGQLGMMTGRPAAAIAEFESVLEIEPDHASARLLLIKALIDAGELTRARDDCDRILNWSPRSSVGYHLRAMVHVKEGRSTEATDDYRKALKYASFDSPELHFELGRALAVLGENEEARTNLLRALELQPDAADVHFELGKLSMQSGKTEDAISELTEALSLDETYEEARGLLQRARQARDEARQQN